MTFASRVSVNISCIVRRHHNCLSFVLNHQDKVLCRIVLNPLCVMASIVHRAVSRPIPQFLTSFWGSTEGFLVPHVIEPMWASSSSTEEWSASSKWKSGMLGCRILCCEVVVGTTSNCLPTSVPVLPILLRAILYSLQYLYSFPAIVHLFLLSAMFASLSIIIIYPTGNSIYL